MKKIIFTITEDEIKDIAKRDISDEQIRSVLTRVEFDEVLWNDIHDSIVAAISEQ